MKYKNSKKIEYKNLSCPNCKSDNTIKWGKRKTEHRGRVQRYFCKDCNNTFINDPFYRMRNNPQKITCALDLFYRGLSTREVQNHFQAFFPHNSDHSTILRWIKKFSLKIASFTDNLKVQTGSYMEIDEMEFHRRKNHKKGSKGVDKNWFIDGIDVKTRFMVSSKYAKARNKKEIKEVLGKIKEKANISRPKLKLTTDGLQLYEDCVQKIWGYRNLKKGFIEHNVVTQSKGEGFNIWIERLHNSIRQRTRGFRGLHGSLESAYSLMKGIEIYYNFIKKHEALQGKTPSELATNIKLTNPNKWLELIKLTENKSL